MRFLLPTINIHFADTVFFTRQGRSEELFGSIQVMAIDIGFYLSEGHQLLDLAGALCAFQYACDKDGNRLYRLRVVSGCGRALLGNVGIAVQTTVESRSKLHTLIAVGGEIMPMLAAHNVAAFTALASNASRVASVCTGAFLLAEGGMLNGKIATTHWCSAQKLQLDYPAIKVNADLIYARDREVWTSAGITAGIDMALAIIEYDFGIDVSRRVSQHLLVNQRRAGGQSQFSPLSQMQAKSDRISATLTYARENVAPELSVEMLAQIARLSTRQFSRAFKRETGETPAKAIEKLRSEAARVMVEESSHPIEAIALSVGFQDSERMRRAFLRIFGHSPQSMRRASRAT
jgi:transcriptional regulator GlxA family with amidase domain